MTDKESYFFFEKAFNVLDDKANINKAKEGNEC